jgi:uncharacterized membrane protein YvlD (DUF360 family)
MSDVSTQLTASYCNFSQNKIFLHVIIRQAVSEVVLQKTFLIFGIFSFFIAAVIFVFGDGLRRWYSGIFFVILGVVLIGNAKRLGKK